MTIPKVTHVVRPGMWVRRQAVQSYNAGKGPYIPDHRDDGSVIDGFREQSDHKHGNNRQTRRGDDKEVGHKRIKSGFPFMSICGSASIHAMSHLRLRSDNVKYSWGGLVGIEEVRPLQTYEFSSHSLRKTRTKTHMRYSGQIS